MSEPGFEPAEGEGANDRSRSLAGTTTSSRFSKLQGSTSCWTCGYRDCPAEIERCERAGPGTIDCPHRGQAGRVDR